MNTILKLNKTAWIAFFVSAIAAFIMAATAHAQSPATSSAKPEDLAKKYNVTFPVAQLGGCSSFDSCRTFCEDPLNQQTCIAFAKSKGFYKEPEVVVNKAAILTAAKTNLGCDSETSCLNFCSVPANHDRCDSFAHSQGMTGGVVTDPAKAEIVEKAKAALGCSSESSCKSFCEQEGNRGKCESFAKQVGLHGGEHKVGPGGCTSEASCKALCSDPNNFQVCSGFVATAGQSFTGPGGCNNEVSCRSYCQQHPADCRSFGGGAGQGGPPAPGYSPAEMCNRTPNCSWSSNGCQCGFYGETKETAQKAQQYAAYCQANPDKCRGGQAGGLDTNQQRQQFEDYCSKNPSQCQAPTGGSAVTTTRYFDPAQECTRYGCSYSLSTGCQCAGIRETYHESRESQEAACRSGGGTCNWSGDVCNCQGYRYSYPTPYSGNYSPGPYSYPTPGTTYSYPTPYSGGPGSCQQPSGGCPSGWYWNASACSCNPTAGNYPTPGGPGCTQPAGGCPSGWTWVSSACSCNYTGGGTSYSYPTPGTTYSYPTPYAYSYPTPYSGGTYPYPTPYSYSYPTPQTYSYPTPQAYSYPTPQAYSYPTPQAYNYPTPQAYSYPTPQSYSYPPPGGVHGVSTTSSPSLWEIILSWFR